MLSLSEWVTIGPYRTPAIDIDGVVVYTNKPPSGAFRGFGNPQATFARESLLEIAARRLGLDPADFRRRNLIRPQDLPGQTVTGLRLETLPIDGVCGPHRACRRLSPPPCGKAGPPRIGVVHMLEWGGGCRWHGDYDSDESSVTIAVEAGRQRHPAHRCRRFGPGPRHPLHADRRRVPRRARRPCPRRPRGHRCDALGPRHLRQPDGRHRRVRSRPRGGGGPRSDGRCRRPCPRGGA